MFSSSVRSAPAAANISGFKSYHDQRKEWKYNLHNTLIITISFYMAGQKITRLNCSPSIKKFRQKTQNKDLESTDKCEDPAVRSLQRDVNPVPEPRYWRQGGVEGPGCC